MLEDVKKVRAKIPNIFLPLMGPHVLRVGLGYVHTLLESFSCRQVICNSSLKGDVTPDDSQQRFLAQDMVAMLEQCCNHSKQCRNNVVTLYCAENRRCESSRVTSPLDFLKVVRLVFWSGVVGPGSLALRAHCRATRSKARLVSKSTSPLEIGAAQLRSVTEIAPKPVSLCVNRSHIRYGFRAVVKAIRYSEHSLRK